MCELIDVIVNINHRPATSLNDAQPFEHLHRNHQEVL